MTEETITQEAPQASLICPEHPERGPFKSQAALNTHKARAHGKGWSTTSNLSGKSKKDRLAKRREYQRKLRARYEKEGKDSRGYPKKHGGGVPVGSKLAKWSPARHKKFRATWEAKKNGLLPQPQKSEDPREFFNHCPNCGHNLVAHYLAAGAARRHAK